jgi:radical SAM protein with 4Fe4S-binding SPASM domain
MAAFDRFRNWVTPTRLRFADTAVAPSIYHFTIAYDHGTSRVHLRIDSDGSGVLFVNANTIYNLNPSGARMAFLSLNNVSEDEVIRTLRSEYAVSPVQVRADYAAFKVKLNGITDPNGGCPICDYELETNAPFSSSPSAPYRMDLALTYRCNNDCSHCYNESHRDGDELSVSAWKIVLSRLWTTGIPHIVFTGGEPTLYPDLAELIRYAGSLGQITGLNTNGRKLKDQSFITDLVDAGLDHVQITLESHLESIHDRMVTRQGAWNDTILGIQNALSQKLFVMTNTTLLKENSRYLPETLEFLAEMGVPTVGLNALIYSGNGRNIGTGLDESELPDLLEKARAITARYHQRLIWYTPTQYCRFDPVQMQLGVKGCTAALYNMCIEPDGSVIPCQSFYTPLGNIQTDPWDSIWNHPLASRLRNRSLAPSKCLVCSFFTECGGGCPLESGIKNPEPNNMMLGITK